jgi:hypothetical protein
MAHQPKICFAPSLDLDFVDGIIRENWFFTLGANGHKNNDRTVENVAQILMCGILASGLF